MLRAWKIPGIRSCYTQEHPAGLHSDIVLRVALVTGALHGKVPVEVLHLTLLLDEVLADAMQGHDQCMPVLAIDLFLEGELIPLEIAILTLVAILNGDGRELDDLFELLLGDVDALLPVLHILIGELDLAPRILGLADDDLHHFSHDEVYKQPAGAAKAC